MVSRKAEFPVHLETTEGVSLIAVGLVAPMAVFMPFLFLTSFGPGETSAKPPAEFYSAELVGILISALSVFLYRWRSVFEADERGVTITEGRWTISFHWHDIRDVTAIPTTTFGPSGPVNSGIRVNIIGRSDQKNRYNLIPWDYGLNSRAGSSEVAAIIERGINKWGQSVQASHSDGPESGGSTLLLTAAPSTPSDIAKNLYNYRFDRQAIFVPFLLLVMVLNVSAWIERDYRTFDDLNRHGVRFNAPTVNHYVSANCARPWCPFYADFRIPTPERGANALPITLHRARINLQDDNAEVYAFVAATKAIPIVYDPRRADLYAVNFYDNVYSYRPIQRAIDRAGLVFGFLMPVPLIGMVLFLSASRRLRARD